MKTLYTIYTNFAKRLALTLTLLLTLGVTTAWAAVETVDFSQQGYENGYAVSSYEGTDFSVSFTAGTNSNAPKYYSSGSAIRCYGGNTFTITSASNITKIVITFGSSDGSNAISTNVESYSNGTWTGTSKSIKFTIGGSSGNRRIQKLAVTYDSGYTITYNTNGGSAVSSTTGTKLPNPLPTTTKTGYTFAGWYTDSNLTTAAVAGTTISENTTLYAKWTANKYTVEFNGNGNTGGSMSDQSFTYGTAQNLTPNAFEKYGHTFAGWSKTSNGSVAYTDGQSVSNLTSTNNGTVTLHAKWTEKDLTNYRTTCSTKPVLSVTYNGNGNTSGSVPTDATEYKKDDQVTVLDNTGSLAKTGYTFSGWNTEANGTGTPYTAGATFTITENTTLYAQWTAYTVTWTINPLAGGSLSATSGNSTTVSPNAAYTYGAPAYTVTSGTATVSQNGDTFSAVPTANCTIQINMVEKPKYTVTFNAGSNGTCSTTSLTETSANAGVTLPSVTPASGYRFLGWSTTSSATTADAGTAGETYKPSSDITLYAVYKQLHTITWMVGSNSVLTEEVANATGVTQTPGDDIADGAIGSCANKFMGWSETPLGSAEGQSAPSDLCSAADMKSKHTSVTGDKTFYAVFATVEGSLSQVYTKITSNNDLTSGDYVIAYSYDNGTQIVLKNQESSNDKMKADALTPSNDVYTDPNSDYVWHLEKKSDGIYTIYSADAEKNLYATTDELQLLGTATKYQIAYDNTNIRWTIKLNSSTNYYVHGYVSGTSYDFRVSTSGSNSKYRVYLYKNTSSISYSNYVTNCCNTPAPTNGAYTSVSGTEIKLTWNGTVSRYHITCANPIIDDHTESTSYKVSSLTECEEYTFYVSAHPTVGCESATIEIPVKPYIPKTVTFDDGTTTMTQTTSCTSKTVIVPTPTAQNCSTYVWIDEETGTEYTAGQTITPAKDMTIVAKWSVITHTITFKDWDGTQLQQSTVEYGQTPSYTGETPTKEADAVYQYTFAGWSPAIVPAKDNATYTATYNKTKQIYTVEWYVNGKIAKTEQVEAEDYATAPDIAKVPCGAVIAGWTDAEGGKYEHDSSTLHQGAKPSIQILSNKKFYAVFADIDE